MQNVKTYYYYYELAYKTPIRNVQLNQLFMGEFFIVVLLSTGTLIYTKTG